MDAAKNFAVATVAQGYDDAATEIEVTANPNTIFPVVPFNATWWNVTDFPNPVDDPYKEIIRITAMSGSAPWLLTIGARAAEPDNTGGAVDHNIEGKAYRLMAGITAKVINDLPFRWVADTIFQVEAGALKAVAIGDPDAEGNGTALRIDDNTGRISAECAELSIGGKIGIIDYAAASSGVGAIAGKIPIYDLADFTTIIGYIPFYSSIT